MEELPSGGVEPAAGYRISKKALLAGSRQVEGMENPVHGFYYGLIIHAGVVPVLILIIGSNDVREPLEKDENMNEKNTDGESAEKQGFFGRIKKGINKTLAMTRDAVGQRISFLKKRLNKTRLAFKKRVFKILGSKRVLDNEAFEELFDALLSTDMGPKLTDEIMTKVEEAYLDKEIESPDKIIDFIKEEIKKELPETETAPISAASPPTVILVVGVNGTGKTTTIGKLAKYYVASGRKVLLGAADTFRAAAIEQLEIWAERAGVDIVTAEPGQDPGSVAFNTVAKAVSKGFDIVLIDTAGRLQDKANLMRELEKLRRVIRKHIPEAPHEILLVLDGTHGQNAVSQAKTFTDVVGVTGLVVTKLDGTAKGGAVLSLRREVRLPVKFIGVGEKIDDLQQFIADEFVDALFDTVEEAGQPEDGEVSGEDISGGELSSETQEPRPAGKVEEYEGDERLGDAPGEAEQDEQLGSEAGEGEAVGAVPAPEKSEKQEKMETAYAETAEDTSRDSGETEEKSKGKKRGWWPFGR